MNAPLTRVELTGVPETALWNLCQRASAVRAGHLDDPRAVEVLARLDYPFERFGLPYGGLAARLHAQRVRTVDAALRRVLPGAPDATVVALGEGFETQFWRVDDGRLRWLALDLPEVAAVRRVVLPDGPRNRTLAGSAADAEWAAQVDRGRPDGYRPPDWTWTVDAGELRQLRELPGLTNVREVPQAGGDRLLGVLRRVPGLKSQLPAFPVFQARLGLDAA
jgi:O-methyltransferase involved in polyketide biosynthesis